jgi:dTDP-4-dehydrorhamnose reductase
MMAERVSVDDLLALSKRTALITGAGGMLGSAFVQTLRDLVPSCRVLARDHQALDVTDRDAVIAIAGESPDLIIHCAADVNADRCERQPSQTHAVQVGGTLNIIELAHVSGAQVVFPQSILIYDGRELPVDESTVPAPLSVYGRAKLEAEQRLLAALPQSLVVRMSGFFGGAERDKNFVGSFTKRLFQDPARGLRTYQIGTRVWQPTYTRDLAANTLLLVAGARTGIYNMGSHGEATFACVARACVSDLGLSDTVSIDEAPGTHILHEHAPRPFRMVVSNRRLAAEGVDRQRPWREALREYLSHPFFQSAAHSLRCRS